MSISKNRLIYVSLALSMLPLISQGAMTPEALMPTLNVSGIELPEQTIEIAATEVQAYGDNAQEHCYVFPSFAVFETDSGQVGAESLIVRPRSQGQAIAELCKTARQAGDIHLDHVEGYLVGAKGPYLFVTSSDSSGAPGSLTLFQTTAAQSHFDIVRDNRQPLTVTLNDGVLAIDYAATLQVDCDLNVEACWPKTLLKNRVPPDVTLVRPRCEGKDVHIKNVHLSTPVHIADAAHPHITYQNSQPSCDIDSPAHG